MFPGGSTAGGIVDTLSRSLFIPVGVSTLLSGEGTVAPPYFSSETV